MMPVKMSEALKEALIKASCEQHLVAVEIHAKSLRWEETPYKTKQRYRNKAHIMLNQYIRDGLRKQK